MEKFSLLNKLYKSLNITKFKKKLNGVCIKMLCNNKNLYT